MFVDFSLSQVFALDRFRPEACIVVGNYFSLRGEHEKAILYFRRALRADPGYVAAWTLIGHEFVEVIVHLQRAKLVDLLASYPLSTRPSSRFATLVLP